MNHITLSISVTLTYSKTAQWYRTKNVMDIAVLITDLSNVIVEQTCVIPSTYCHGRPDSPHSRALHHHGRPDRPSPEQTYVIPEHVTVIHD